jgi:glycogen operon protein
LGRESYGFDPWSGFFDAIRQDPVLAPVKLISEPWDIGPGGYQVGNHPAGMAEWNGRYRDDVRRYWKGDAGLRGALAARLLGSADLFDHHRRRPWASVNFVTAHDGFTLTDLVSYNSKHNEHNGENNQDGTNENDSSNWGVEGPTEDEGIQHQREKVKRNLLATLLLSQGTPMLLAGDEFGHTQQGNNNAYCQDNDISWLDWSLQAAGPGQKMLAFTQRLLALRKASVLLRGDAFQHATEEILPGVRDVFWFDERGNELSQADWENANARLLGLRRAGLRDDGTVDLLIVLHNSDGAEHRFVLPAPHFDFRLCIDTQIPEKPESILAEEHYDVSGHSVVLLAAAVHPVAEPAISGKLERRTARAGEAKSLIAADQEADDPSDLDGLDGAAGVPA